MECVSVPRRLERPSTAGKTDGVFVADRERALNTRGQCPPHGSCHISGPRYAWLTVLFRNGRGGSLGFWLTPIGSHRIASVITHRSRETPDAGIVPNLPTKPIHRHFSNFFL